MHWHQNYEGERQLKLRYRDWASVREATTESKRSGNTEIDDLNKGQPTLKVLQDDEEMVLCYTGLSNFATLQVVFNLAVKVLPSKRTKN